MDNPLPPQSPTPLADLPVTDMVTPTVILRPPIIAFFIELIQTLVLAGILYGMIDVVVARVRVENVSMRPTLQPGEFLLVNKMAYNISNLSRGDIVVFHYNATEDYIKRLIGLPGDTVEVKNGTVTVNQYVLDEPYISAPPQYNGKWEVPAGSVFVLGDNRNQSSDSHSWGFVPMEKIVGKALVIYWPFKNAKVLTHPSIVNAAAGQTP